MFGGPASANAVPEPSTFLLAVFALTGVAGSDDVFLSGRIVSKK